MNLVEATIDGGTLRFGGFSIPAANGALAGYGQDTVIVGIRPADMEDADVRPDDGPTISVRADVTEELGSEVNILFRVDAPPVAADVIMAATDEEGEELLLLADDTPGVMFCARVDARTKVQPGEDVRLTLDPSRFHYFDPATGLAVGAAA
jgi:multiple sugar transport system ATP-binding protein